MNNNAGKAILAGMVGLAAWKILGPQRRQKIINGLDSLLVAAEEKEKQQERERSALISSKIWVDFLESLKAPLPDKNSSTSLLPGETYQRESQSVDHNSFATKVASEQDSRWRATVIHPSVLLILGKRGSGKTALGYRFLEMFRYVATPYVVGVSPQARTLLPKWIGIATSLGEVPNGSVCLVDEAYLAYHSRASMTEKSRAMSQLLNLSRQRGQTLIFVSQEARQVDRNVASSANVLIFKNLGMLQLEFDRPELSKLAAQAREAFATVKGDPRTWSFVYAPDCDFIGLLENEPPSFWKPGLSRLFAAGPNQASARNPNRTTPHDKALMAKEMRANGATYSMIAEALGVTRGTVVNYLKGYPYRSK